MGIFSIFPDRASTTAGEVDALYAFLLVVGIVMTIADFFLRRVLRLQVPPQRSGLPPQGDPRLDPARNHLERDPVPGHAGDVRMGNQALFPKLHAAAQGHARYLCHRQAMDVESSISRWPARDQ